MSYKNTSVIDAEIVQPLRDYFNTEIEELFSCNFSRIRLITAQILAVLRSKNDTQYIRKQFEY